MINNSISSHNDPSPEVLIAKYYITPKNGIIFQVKINQQKKFRQLAIEKYTTQFPSSNFTKNTLLSQNNHQYIKKLL